MVGQKKNQHNIDHHLLQQKIKRIRSQVQPCRLSSSRENHNYSQFCHAASRTVRANGNIVEHG
eukprot:9639489-Prorocentrum_lima.AAC.1